MSFYTYARKVRKTELSFNVRRVAFRSCVECYHWLCKQSFRVIYARYSNYFGFDSDVPDASERLSQAMDALEKERNLFLERLRLFDKRRIKEKMRGQRSPSKSVVEALYKCDWFEVQDDK